MKALALLALVSATAISQEMNPDGYIGSLTFKISPYFTSGALEQRSPDGNLLSKTEYPTSLQWNVAVVMPLSRKLTVSAFYDFSKQDNITTLVPSNRTANNPGSIRSFGATFTVHWIP